MNTTTRTTSTLLSAALIASLVVATSACGRRGGADLPDTETFFMALPEDDAADDTSSASQALTAAQQAACASTDGYDDLKERIELYNEAIRARVALIKLMIKAAERSGGGSVTRTASRDGFTATLTAVDDGEGTVTYTVTLENPQGETTTLLDGTSNADLSAGAWDVSGLTQSRSVHVDWTNADGTLTVDRTATGDFGTRTSHYVRTDSDVDITFTGPDHDATAHWSRETFDGSITVDGTEHCWDANEDVTELCSADCPTP